MKRKEKKNKLLDHCVNNRIMQAGRKRKAVEVKFIKKKKYFHKSE